MARGKPPKRVICVDTGKVYESITQCNRETGLQYRNLRHGIPFKGKLYRYYNRSEHPGFQGQEDEEMNDELYFEHFFEAFRNKHPEYNNVIQTMTAKEYANYLRERKGLK